MKIYTHTQNTPALDLGLIFKLAFTALFLMSLFTLSHADAGYECTTQENGQCLIDMTKVLDENIYDIDDALKYCEDINGTYTHEEDVCILD